MKIHIPLKSKSISKDIFDNFLFQNENIYLMDNHRLALWCWLQKIDLKKKYNLLHIDAHPDMSDTALIDFNRKLMSIESMTLTTYQNLIQERFNIPLFRWDNYLRIFTERYGENYIQETAMSFTHHLGSDARLTHDLSSIHLLRELDAIFNQKKFINTNAWIVNLDLDYFYTSSPHKKIMYSDDFLEMVGECLASGLANKEIAVLTIAFSPECCGSWENAEDVFHILNRKLKIDIKL